ncbi:hypothetical protein D0C36_23740 [Mucilaginibacter conchicola]|uniref:DUF304 domain-containing protein n=1 Tax=Mucilaginibacter conchicola TaxID=2303333 RepID=A0A372NP08_9SPHI|nr:hypothetical protein [Mucilaginibacter conchicola]RFZ89973.1 hypothetical protein D0C36_23740 [Mucilaginibacter conchicola]
MQLPKSYYLPPYRSIIIGTILIVMGLCFTFMGVDIKASLGDNLQWVFLSFRSIGDFIFSFIMLVFKAGFIGGGYLFIRFANGIERAKLDEKGFYYREIPKGGGVSKLAMDSRPLTFVPYPAIKEIHLRKSMLSGMQLLITLNSGTVPMVALGVLSKQEKQEIVDFIKTKINNPVIKT